MKEGDSSRESGLWNTVRSLFGDGPEPTLREQIEEAIDEHEDDPAPDEKGDLSPVERQMVRNLLSFGKRTVDDVGVPRADIVAIPETSTFAELVAVLADAPHSRLPVYRDSLDQVVGMIHIKDAFALLARGEPFPETISGLIRQPLYVPQSMGVLDLLAEMRAQRVHLAIVIDEYSGTEGLVTIEDLVEEIVGDIEDETDDAVVPQLVQLEDGMWDADARAELEDIAETVDPRLAVIDEDVDTIGGLAFMLAGHVPQPGEMLMHDSGWRIEVTEGDTRRATRLRLHPPIVDPEGGAASK
ncbi:hemolysin family protein [Sphingomonas sp. SUN039]|uniref:hemolysin family protein n=1 Tax=Sphingomonas sp. SUN039 TaxID=2937787 RepID=UPI002164B95C|nr:hemolysin family protein [Sphingomonas sp. SUN039]UVO54762.1 hemolysin family protein [Sphingomonas sp. SUN039]